MVAWVSAINERNQLRKAGKFTLTATIFTDKAISVMSILLFVTANVATLGVSFLAPTLTLPEKTFFRFCRQTLIIIHTMDACHAVRVTHAACAFSTRVATKFSRSFTIMTLEFTVIG
jgi:hypothetical protein